MTALIIIGLIVLVAVFAMAKGKRKASNKTGWHIEWSPGMPAQPTPQGAGWHFDFPTIPTSHVHYVQWFNPPPLGSEVRVRFRVTGGGFVPQEYPDRPALVSLLIQRKGDDWGAQGPMQSYRWFSRQTVTLAEGEHELTVPLTVAHWGDVFNGQDAAAFAAAIRDVDNIALIFGSDGGRGHGVYATQPSRFTLLSCETS
jgi:hypothetical protein